MKIGISLSVFLLLLGGCTKENKAPYGRPPAVVTVAEVEQKDVPMHLETIGNVESPAVVQVRPQVSGQLIEAFVKEGQWVEKQQLLYCLDPAPFQAAVDRAQAILAKDEAALKFAKMKLERYQDLIKQEFIAPVAFEELQTNVEAAEAQVKMDRAELESAQIHLERTFIYSPIQGRVSRFAVHAGNWVTVNDPNAITEIRQMKPIDVVFSYPQHEVLTIHQKQNESPLSFQALLPHQKEEEGFTGRVHFLDNHIDTATGTLLLKGSLQNEQELLLPGQFVRIKLFVNTLPGAFLIPIEALQRGQKGEYVYIAKADNTVEMRPVVSSGLYQNKIVIKDGLKPQDHVVVTGQLNLAPGARVLVKNKKTEAEAPNSPSI